MRWGGCQLSAVSCQLLTAACAPVPLGELPAATAGEQVVVQAAGYSGATERISIAQARAETGRVTVAASPAGKPPLEIVALGSTWDLKARTARFTGDVTVTRGEVVMRCGVLDVAYADADHIDRVVATGSVEVRHGARTATSGRAELEGATGRVTLTEEARLAEGPNTLTGARITLWLDDDRAQCEGLDGSSCKLVVDGTALK